MHVRRYACVHLCVYVCAGMPEQQGQVCSGTEHLGFGWRRGGATG